MVRTVVVVSMLLPALGMVAVPGPASAAARTCHGHQATIVGTGGSDRISGTRGRDVIVGLGGNDSIDGGGGDDIICGGAGADDLVGGGGDDRLYGGRDEHEDRGRRTRVTGDLLEGGPGDDHLDAGYQRARGPLAIQRRDTVSYAHSARPVAVDLRSRTAEGEGSDVVHRVRYLDVRGSRYDDVLLGSHLPESLDGGRGDDTVAGRGGNDEVVGYEGTDDLRGGRGSDFVLSGAGRDTLRGGDGPDWILAWGTGPATVLGGRGADLVSRTVSGRPIGVLDGGPGENQLDFELALDSDGRPSGVLDSAAGTAVVTADDQTFTTTFTGFRAFNLWGPRWTFRGTADDDFVQGVDGRLDAQSFAGDDFLLGAQRNDTLDGGDDHDIAWGGGGDNTCLNVEEGSCTGYPWDRQAARSPYVVQPAATTRHASVHQLRARWALQARSASAR